MPPGECATTEGHSKGQQKEGAGSHPGEGRGLHMEKKRGGQKENAGSESERSGDGDHDSVTSPSSATEIRVLELLLDRVFLYVGGTVATAVWHFQEGG